MISIYLIPRIYCDQFNYSLIKSWLLSIKCLLNKGFNTYIINRILSRRIHFIERRNCDLIINIGEEKPGGKKIQMTEATQLMKA